MPEGKEHHERVALTIAVGLGRLDQPLDLVDGQVLPGPKVAILASARRNCSIFSGWLTRCRRSIHTHFMNSFKMLRLPIIQITR